MSTTTTFEVYPARINTRVHISLTGLSSTNHRPTGVHSTSCEASTASRPTIQPTVRHGSLTTTVCPPVSVVSQDRLYLSQSKTAVVGHDRRRMTEHLDLRTNINTGFVVKAALRRRAAPLPPRLPLYTDTVPPPPPPYNPNFLAPMSCERWSDAGGRRWWSMSACYPSAPPPTPRCSSRSATTEICSRSSLLLVNDHQQSVMDSNDNDDDDDVFLAEKPTTLGQCQETCC